MDISGFASSTFWKILDNRGKRREAYAAVTITARLSHDGKAVIFRNEGSIAIAFPQPENESAALFTPTVEVLVGPGNEWDQHLAHGLEPLRAADRLSVKWRERKSGHRNWHHTDIPTGEDFWQGRATGR